MARVNCEENKLLCTQFKIKGYPTIILLKEDQFFVFKGKRTLKMFKDFALLKGYEFAEKQGNLPKKLHVHPDHAKESYFV